MTDRTELLAAILSDPACDVKRLAYADLLEDSGEEIRARFIRKQIAHQAVSPPLTMLVEVEPFLGVQPHLCFRWGGKEHALSDRTYATAINQLPEDKSQHRTVQYRRGFIVALRGPLKNLLEHGPAIVAANPVERVEVLDHKPIYVTEATGSCWVADYGLTIVRHITEDDCRDALNAAALAELRRRAGQRKAPAEVAGAEG